MQAELKKELIIMIGPSFSGKSFYVNQNFTNSHQIISHNNIKDAMSLEGSFINEETVCSFMAINAKAHMLRALPIVVDEQNLTIESLFIWKKICLQFGYSMKAIVMDTHFDECAKRFQSITLEGLQGKNYQAMIIQHEMLMEMKMVLELKHQKIVDSYEIII